MIDQHLTFRCINLVHENNKSTPFHEIINSITSGFHSFYTHASIISGIRESVSGVGLPDSFSNLFTGMTKQSIRNYLKNDTSNKPALVLIDRLGQRTEANEVISFFQRLREQLSNTSEQFNLSFSLNQAVAWDLFLEREKYSGIIPGVHNYHEYLLWDDGGLWEKIKWNSTDKSAQKDQYAWIGAGWLSAILNIHSDKVFLPNPFEISCGANEANDELSRSLDSLATFYQNKEVVPYN